MKKVLLLCCVLAMAMSLAQGQIRTGQGVAGMNVDNVVEMELLTQTELGDKVAKGWTSVFLPTGGTEIRGPHAIIGVHTILATHRAVEAAKRVGKTIVAPTIPYAVGATGGFNANSWKSFAEENGATAPNPGAIQVTSETFKGIVQGGVESLMYIGFKDIFLMGDHGGGQQEMRQVSEEMSAKFASKGIRVHYVPDFYNKTHEDIDMYMCEHKLPIAGHGGMMETAEMMYWEPTQFAYIRPNFKTVPYSGSSDNIEGCKERLEGQRAARTANAGRGGGGRGAGAEGAAAGGGGRGAAGGGRGAGGAGRGAAALVGGASNVSNGLSGNPHPATKAIGKDLAEIGIMNTVNQVKKILAEKKGSN
jgi:creatinine amidohydrolase/Fe(II)-dependent formamide hydrolase-like protein